MKLTMDGNKLRGLLEATNTTQRSFAYQIGVTERTISRWVMGEMKIKEPYLTHIKKWMNKNNVE